MKILPYKDNYSSLFEEVFGSKPDLIPREVYQIEHNDIVGFVSGHKNFDGFFYIEYAGILPKFQKKGYVRYLRSALDSIGDKFITAVHNQNKETIKILNALNFTIIGFKAIDNKSYVEFMRY